jgi:parallel beta-helix repeat protein
MSKKLVLVLAFTILLIWLLCVELKAEVARAGGAIYIKADGGVEGTDRIQRDGDLYVFVDDIYDKIVIQRSNMTIDGNGRTLQGTGSGYGFSLSEIKNVTIKNTKIKGFTSGVHLNSASNNTILGNNITENYNGIGLIWSSNNTVSENHITNNYFQGIRLDSSFNNIFSENNITNNEWYGVKLLYSFSNTFSGNHITNNTYQGIQLHLSSSSIFSGNMLNGNKYNFDVWGNELGHFMHSIDVSNLIDGKPLYYFVNQKGLVINSATHPQVGYLALINCTNTMVEGLTLTDNGQGLLLAYTNNSRITDNNITNNDFGIWLESTFDNTIYGCCIENNDYGVWLGSSSNNALCGNNITNNRYGIWPYVSFDNVLSGNCIEKNRYGVWFDSSFKNTVSRNNIEDNLFGFWFCGSYNNSLSGNNIKNNGNGIRLGYDPSFGNAFFGNNITNNDVGVKLMSSSNNRFYRNNFVNNTMQAYNYPGNCGNVWDDGVEGNYWSDYDGADTNYDGIGDSWYEIDENNTDHYPLMGMFSSFNTSLGDVYTICNSTISDFQCYFNSENQTNVIRFNVNGIIGTGFCRICIPHTILNETYTILVDGNKPDYVNYALYDNDTHRWIHFTYLHSIHKVIIIPEFPSSLILPLFLIATLLAVIIHRKNILYSNDRTPVP